MLARHGVRIRTLPSYNIHDIFIISIVILTSGLMQQLKNETVANAVAARKASQRHRTREKVRISAASEMTKTAQW